MKNNLDQDELSHFFEKYENLANKKDFNILKSFISEKAIFWFSDGSFHGLSEIKVAFERTWSVLPNEKYSLSDLQWLVQNDNSATVIYKFTSESLINGKKSIFKGRGTNVLLKTNGKWQIIHEHLSLEPKTV